MEKLIAAGRNVVKRFYRERAKGNGNRLLNGRDAGRVTGLAPQSALPCGKSINPLFVKVLIPTQTADKLICLDGNVSILYSSRYSFRQKDIFVRGVRYDKKSQSFIHQGTHSDGSGDYTVIPDVGAVSILYSSRYSFRRLYRASIDIDAISVSILYSSRYSFRRGRRADRTSRAVFRLNPLFIKVLIPTRDDRHLPARDFRSQSFIHQGTHSDKKQHFQNS